MRRPVLHLEAVELSSRICDKIERRVLRCRKQDREPFAHQVGMDFGDAQIAFVLRVVSHHRFQSKG